MNDEQSFINNIRQALDSSTEQLDAGITRRLRLARAKALESYPEKYSFWKPAGSFALASMLLVVIGVWQFGGNERVNTVDGMAQVMEDLEMIASSDSLHLYENLEFYQWLEVIEGNAG